MSVWIDKRGTGNDSSAHGKQHEVRFLIKGKQIANLYLELTHLGLVLKPDEQRRISVYDYAMKRPPTSLPGKQNMFSDDKKGESKNNYLNHPHYTE